MAYYSDESSDDDSSVAHDLENIANYDAAKILRADFLFATVVKHNPGRYVGCPMCMKLVRVLIRAVAVRTVWYSNQKMLRSQGMFRKIRAWAPELFQYRGGIYALIDRAEQLGLPIHYRKDQHKLEVIEMIQPILKQLHPQQKKYGR